MFSNRAHRSTTGGPLRPNAQEGPAFPASQVIARPLRLAQESDRQELQALSAETDETLFYEGLLGFSTRHQQEGRLDLAAETYAAILGAAPEGPQRNRAQAGLDAILGHGGRGARAEFLLRRLAQEASDPAALFAMGSAGLVFRMSRLAMMSRLALSPSANFLTRGFGARALASFGAFTLEAPSFTLAGRLGNAALGRAQDWSEETLAREFASSFLVLGGLKVAGALSNGAYRRLGGRPGIAQQAFAQTSMLGGIYLGHGLERLAGLRRHQDGAMTLIDSLALLLQFHVAGNLSRHAFGSRFGAWERSMDLQVEALSEATPRGSPFRPRSGWEGALLASAQLPSKPEGSENSFGFWMSMMEGGGEGPGSDRSPLTLPKLGTRPSYESPRGERLNREEAERQLRGLMPRGYVEPVSLERPGFVKELLSAFGITTHSFDESSFRRGFEIARRYPERVQRVAFDIDEVYLHWAFSPRDIFQGAMEKGAEAVYRNTSPELLQYQSFQVSEGVQLNLFEKLWFDGIQRLFPTRFRQHVQLHPGVRAFQLGLRLGQEKNLIMATTGPAGRILRLANEDPAMKMIYFGKTPTEAVSIVEVREGLNIYTREDLVLAMRGLKNGDLRYSENPTIESYLAKIREFPTRGVKLKHPAISVLRGKRAFDTLVDDSGSTFEMLGDLPGFSVLQPPSARPSSTLNFTLGSPEKYLSRMSNSYASELGDLLAAPEPPPSTRLSFQSPAPENYPLQRFSIEIPWGKFGAEFVAPNRELRSLSAGLVSALPLPSPARPSSRKMLALTGDQLRSVVERIYREFDLLLEQKPGEVSVETDRTALYRDLAQNSPEDLHALLERFLTPQEIVRLPQAALPASERGPKYFSRIASLISVKRAVCHLLALDAAEHSLEVQFRFGRPVLSGVAAERLGQNKLLTTLADDGEVGIGIALLEPGIWDSGLVG
ncbi:MAG: hypothetical protein K8R69_10085, partial [Deltaproteobacteria bacterium]|nr:hypothetical protein [Deltaproteobacteria bacterium]